MIVGAYLDRAAPDHPAGAEWAVHDAFAWLAARGHDCRIVSRLAYTQAVVDGVRVYGHPSEEELAQHYQECDVMLTQLDGLVHAEILAATYQTPLVVYAHSAYQVEDVVASCCALLLFNSDHVAADAAWWPGESLVLHPPVLAERVRVEPGSFTTLVGLSAEKGGTRLYALAQELEGYRLLGVQGAYGTQQVGPHGLTPHGPNETDSGLPANLAVLGNLRDIRDALRNTRQLLVLSHSETYGRIAAEAAVSGIPTICVDTPGLRECLGDAAVYVDRDEAAFLVRAIREGYDADEWQTRSTAALARWHGTLAPRQETELRRFERALRRIANDQPEMTL